MSMSALSCFLSCTAAAAVIWSFGKVSAVALFRLKSLEASFEEFARIYVRADIFIASMDKVEFALETLSSSVARIEKALFS